MDMQGKAEVSIEYNNEEIEKFRIEQEAVTNLNSSIRDLLDLGYQSDLILDMIGDILS